MELLTIKHQDFEMIVECTKFDNIWNKAKNNVGEENLYSTYSWSEGVMSVILSNHIGEQITIENSQQAPAVFFDKAFPALSLVCPNTHSSDIPLFG